jgi:hypothetical protein
MGYQRKRLRNFFLKTTASWKSTTLVETLVEPSIDQKYRFGSFIGKPFT